MRMPTPYPPTMPRRRAGVHARPRTLGAFRFGALAMALLLLTGHGPCRGRGRGTSGDDGGTGRDAGAPRDAGPTPDPGTPLDQARVFYLGHSLQGWQAPSMIGSFATHAELTYSYEAAIGIGANLAWQWTHPDRAEGSNPRVTLAAEPFDVLVMTEAIPLASQLEWADPAGNAGNFLALAYAENPNVQAYIYETWDYLTVENWRARLDSDRPLWASIVEDVNEAHPGRDVRLIPGGRAMAALYDRIAAGDVPGITSIRDLFVDDIHLTDTGWYFIALVQYATIFRRSPVGLPAATTNRFGEAIPPPPAGAVPVMQAIAWDVVLRDPLAGVAAP